MAKKQSKKRKNIKRKVKSKDLKRQKIILFSLSALLLMLLTLLLIRKDLITVTCDTSNSSNLMGFSSRMIGSNGQSFENQDWSIQLNCDRTFIFADERWGSDMPYYESKISQAQFDDFLRLYQKYSSVKSSKSCLAANATVGKIYEIYGELDDIYIYRKWQDCPSNPEEIPKLYKEIESTFIKIVPDFPY